MLRLRKSNTHILLLGKKIEDLFNRLWGKENKKFENIVFLKDSIDTEAS